MRVVVDRQALRRARRVVRVRLHGVPELSLERAAELRHGEVVKVESLNDDRRATLELGCDALDVRRAGEAGRAPGNRLRVVAGDGDLLALFHDPDAG